MTKDEATILKLAAEALRRPSHTSGGVPMPVNACRLLADALDRIAGVERVTVLEDCEGDDPRFDPEPPLPWETTTLDPRFGSNTAQRSELVEAVEDLLHGSHQDMEANLIVPKPLWSVLRGAIEAEERGKPCNET